MKSMNTSDSQTKQTCVNDTDDTNATYKQLDSTQSRTSSRIRGSINLTRCPAIPFSSPLGLSLGKKSKMMTEVIQQERLDRIERHLHAPALSTSLKPKWITKIYEFDRWSITYKPNRDKTSQPREYVHQYNFGKYNDKPSKYNLFNFFFSIKLISVISVYLITKSQYRLFFLCIF